jgi:predicted nucleic acid-binding protein
MIYLDTSAAIKLVLPEAETAELELWIAERAATPRVSSRLLRIEMLRSVARHAPERMGRANVVLSSVVLVNMDEIASTAEIIGDRALRSLDAIHLATAHDLRAELTAFVCYDKRLIDSARALGLPTESPA